MLQFTLLLCLIYLIVEQGLTNYNNSEVNSFCYCPRFDDTLVEIPERSKLRTSVWKNRTPLLATHHQFLCQYQEIIILYMPYSYAHWKNCNLQVLQSNVHIAGLQNLQRPRYGMHPTRKGTRLYKLFALWKYRCKRGSTHAFEEELNWRANPEMNGQNQSKLESNFTGSSELCKWSTLFSISFSDLTLSFTS